MLAAFSALVALPTAAGAQQPERFSLSMFHFNVQYVAGGLLGFPDGVSDLADYRLDAEAVEDLIVTESFAPAMDLLLAHPTWKLTLEMQGYMIEVMLERHPEVVEKLRTLVDAGQVELVSFHYSDQLFLAYPRVDIERSQQLLDEVVAEAGLTLSPVTFCQEGQFGEGMAQVGPAHGQTILGLPKNLFAFQHAADFDTAAPLYRLGDADVVLIGRSFQTPEVEVTWNYFNDAELWSTNDGSPYLGTAFQLDPARVAAFEQGLADQEAAGYRIASIQDYVAFVKAAGLEQRPLPPMLDGTWQPGSTDSMYRWMGKAGILDVLYQCERDNTVVSGNVQARHEVLAAETLLAWARGEGVVAAAEYPGDLSDCWRTALLGQVTDASGINPFVGEIEYALEHAADARACAGAITADIAARVGRPYLQVDTMSGDVTPLDRRPSEALAVESALLTEADGFTIEAPGRTVDVTWEAIGDTGRLHRVTIGARAPVGGPRTIAVTFPMELDELRLSPGLVEDEVRSYAWADLDLEDGNIGLPVANGLIGLRDDLWLIEDTKVTHVAATFREGEPNVLFRDSTLDPEADVVWSFFVLEGTADDALAEANHRNTHPTLTIAGPPALRVNGNGCSCRSAGGSSPGGLLVIALAALLAVPTERARRRARRSSRPGRPDAGC